MGYVDIEFPIREKNNLMGKFNDKIHSKNTVTKYDIKYQ